MYVLIGENNVCFVWAEYDLIHGGAVVTSYPPFGIATALNHFWIILLGPTFERLNTQTLME